MQVGYSTIAYTHMFHLYRITTLILRAGVAAELYERICEHFIGIGRFRFYLAAALVILTGIGSLAVLRPDLTASSGYPETLVLIIDRWETTLLCASFILTAWFLIGYLNVNPSIRPNVLVHWRLLTVYFGISTVYKALVILTSSANVRFASNLVLLAGGLACFLAWTRYLTRQGEVRPPAVVLSLAELASRQIVRKRILQYVQQAGR